MSFADLPLFVLLVVVTSGIVVAGWVVFGSFVSDRTLAETMRDLWDTFFGGHDNDLPTGEGLNRRLEDHEMAARDDTETDAPAESDDDADSAS